MKQKRNGKPITESLQEYARGVTGGLLFSFPLLFTMEVWWAGFSAEPLELLVLVGATYLLLLGYNRFAGMHPDSSWPSVFIDSVEELGIGLLLAAGVLLTLNRINFSDMALDEAMGKIIIEAMGVSIGVSIGTAQLGAGEEEVKEKKEKEPGRKRNTKLALFVLALCGAVVVGGNVAPTEEVLMLAIEAEPIHILAMAIISLVQSIVVVYFSEFKGSGNGISNSLFYNISFDTCLSYVTALGAATFMLWFFGRFEGVSFGVAFSQVVVLGVLTSLGASAGRLLIK